MPRRLPLLFCPECRTQLHIEVDDYRMTELGFEAVQVHVPAACLEGCGLQLASTTLWIRGDDGQPQIVSYTVTVLRSAPRWQRDPDGNYYLPVPSRRVAPRPA